MALLLIATIVAVYWYFVAPEKAFVITLSVLVVTCPCALALATPAAFAAAAGRFSELHLLLTNGDAIEALSRATHVVFDKTGTLTCGRPTVESITIFDSAYSEDDCMRLAAALERASSHPIASAFRSVAQLPAVTDASVHLAQGVSGSIDGLIWRIGSADFAVDGQIEDMPQSVFLGVAGKCVARFGLRDQVRPDAKETLDTLRTMGIDISLASGDHESAVSALAESLAIDNVYSGCTPRDKLTIIESLQASGERVVMVGDGINDAPVLAGADASIAPGHGALLAQTNADLIMLGDSLRPVVTALTLSRVTLRVVRQNLVWAVLYNAIALPLAAAGLVPPWLAAIGMSLSSLVVVMNALRLNRYS